MEGNSPGHLLAPAVAFWLRRNGFARDDGGSVEISWSSVERFIAGREELRTTLNALSAAFLLTNDGGRNAQRDVLRILAFVESEPAAEAVGAVLEAYGGPQAIYLAQVTFLCP